MVDIPEEESRGYQVTFTAWYLCSICLVLAWHRKRRRPKL